VPFSSIHILRQNTDIEYQDQNETLVFVIFHLYNANLQILFDGLKLFLALVVLLFGHL